MLGIVVAKERPDLEEQKSQLADPSAPGPGAARFQTSRYTTPKLKTTQHDRGRRGWYNFDLAAVQSGKPQSCPEVKDNAKMNKQLKEIEAISGEGSVVQVLTNISEAPKPETLNHQSLTFGVFSVVLQRFVDGSVR